MKKIITDDGHGTNCVGVSQSLYRKVVVICERAGTYATDKVLWTN